MNQELITAARKIILHGPAGYATRSTKRETARTVVIILEHMENSLLTLYLVRDFALKTTRFQIFLWKRPCITLYSDNSFQ